MKLEMLKSAMHKFTMIGFLTLFLFSGTAGAAKSDAPVLENIRIDGLSYDAKKPADSIAMVNGIPLREKDVYRGYRVTAIKKESIIMESVDTGETYELNPGSGKANVQKREMANGNKLNLQIDAPKKKDTARATPGKPGEMPNLLQTYMNPGATVENLKGQINQIKADRDKRDEELNKLFETKSPSEQ